MRFFGGRRGVSSCLVATKDDHNNPHDFRPPEITMFGPVQDPNHRHRRLAESFHAPPHQNPCIGLGHWPTHPSFAAMAGVRIAFDLILFAGPFKIFCGRPEEVSSNAIERRPQARVHQCEFKIATNRRPNASGKLQALKPKIDSIFCFDSPARRHGVTSPVLRSTSASLGVDSFRDKADRTVEDDHVLLFGQSKMHQVSSGFW